MKSSGSWTLEIRRDTHWEEHTILCNYKGDLDCGALQTMSNYCQALYQRDILELTQILCGLNDQMFKETAYNNKSGTIVISLLFHKTGILGKGKCLFFNHVHHNLKCA